MNRNNNYRRRSHSTGVWVIYKDGKRVGTVRALSELYALDRARRVYGYDSNIRVSEIED